jgi:hypothetical protein
MLAAQGKKTFGGNVGFDYCILCDPGTPSCLLLLGFFPAYVSSLPAWVTASLKMR